MRHSLRYFIFALLLATMPAMAQEVVRYKIPGSHFPISAAVEVPAGKSIVFLSGVVPPVANTAAAKGSLAAYGDTKTQTVGALGAIEKQLKTMNLSMGDVVKMQVFLVGDPAKGGKMDFAGFMDGYRQYFGNAQQPKLPSRSAVQVAALASPGFLIEIEVTAVRP
jgi:enamine deaminase RidA (YjgF/YER057c/UK114 family)